MTDAQSAPPKYIPLFHAAQLFGVTTNTIYGMVTRGELRSEMLVGRPVILFDSLPKEKQEAYPALLETIAKRRKQK